MRPLQSYAGNEDPCEARADRSNGIGGKVGLWDKLERGQLEKIFNTTIHSLNLIRRAH